MKNILLLTTVFVLIISACSSPKGGVEVVENTIDLDVGNSEKLDFKKYFDSVKYVALETTKEALIGEITKMYIANNHIIIFDQKSMNIFLFGFDGKFVRKIGKKGEGKDEYSFINDIQFDKERMLILVHERFRNSIYTYDLHGNLLRKTEKSSIEFNSFFKTKEGFWVYSCFSKGNPNCYNLTLLSPDLQNIKKQYFPQKEFVNVTFSPTFVNNEQGRLFFYYPSSNIVYEISRTETLPFLQINFGDRTLPYEKITKAESMEDYDKLLSTKDYLGNINKCFINRDRVFFSFSNAGFGSVKSYNCFYHTESRKANVFNNSFMLSTEYPISTNLLYSTDTMLVYSISPSIFSEDSFAILSQLLSTNIQFDSNVILAMCSLKEQ